MRYWKALDETAKILKPTFLVYKTNENCENYENNNISQAISEKLTENANEVIETKNYVNNSCGYTNCFINGQMAVPHGEAAFLSVTDFPKVNLPREFMDKAEQKQNRLT